MIQRSRPAAGAEEGDEEPAPAVSSRARARTASTLLVLVLAVLLSGVVSATVAIAVVRWQSRTNPQTVDLGNNVTVTENSAIERVASTASPAVVSVESGSANTPSGSGFVLTKDGFIATDMRVVANATGLAVFVPGDAKRHDARVVDSDCTTGLAVIKVDGVSDLPTLAFGDSSALRLGQTLVAISGPLQSDGRVTHGIVSDEHRSVQVADPVDPAHQVQRSDVLRLDAPTATGFAGGPLLNIAGEVVAISSAAPQGSSSTLGVPSNEVRSAVEQVVQGGQISLPSPDAQWSDLSAADAASRSLAPGALVTAVAPGGAADQAGLRVGDVITQVNEVKLDASHPLGELLVTRFRGGQRVAVTLLRGNSVTQVQLTLDSGHPACA